MNHPPKNNRRMCKYHKDKPISHLCLKDECKCPTVICVDCLKDSHKNAPNCPIVKTEPPLSISNINNNKMQHFSDFRAILDQFSEIW